MKSLKRVFLALAAGLAFLMLTSGLALAAGPKKPNILVIWGDDIGLWNISAYNKSFADWGEVFNDHVLATAILDRLLRHATIVNIKGESDRLREKKKAGLLGRRSAPTAEEVTADASS